MPLDDRLRKWNKNFASNEIRNGRSPAAYADRGPNRPTRKRLTLAAGPKRFPLPSRCHALKEGHVMRLLKSALAAAAVAIGLAAPALAADIRIIVVSHGQANDPFWSVVKNGVTAGAKDAGVSVDYRAPETFDMVAMSQLIDAAVNQNPAGLVVSIPDADSLGPSIQKAVAAGIPVISMNSGSDVSKKLGALLHVGQDEVEAGRIAGAKLKEMGGKVGLCVNQEVGNVSLDLRCKGFTEGFGGRVTVLPVTNDPTDVRAKVKAAVAADGSVDTILALGAGTAGEPSVAAVKEAGKAGAIRVATFDMSAGFLKSVAN